MRYQSVSLVLVILKNNCLKRPCEAHTTRCMWVWFCFNECAKDFILDVGMEKQQKQELGWRVFVLPIPAFPHCDMCNMYTVYSEMQDLVMQIPSVPFLVSVVHP